MTQISTVDWLSLRTDVDLVSLVRERVQLVQKGARWLGRCPFHDDKAHPNLDVAPERHYWRCWVCGVGGDAVDWIRMTQNCSTMEAVRYLRQWRGDPVAPARPSRPDPFPRASRSHRDAAYQVLVSTLGLSDRHQDALLARGLSPRQIRANGYASLPVGDRIETLEALRRSVWDLHGIPGVAYHAGRDRWQIKGAPGLLIPVRDRLGRIQACQIRNDGTGPRYQWLTSTPDDHGWTGTSSGTPFHVAGTRWIHPSATWWVTEGPLKADVVASHVHHPVIGIPGVSLWGRVANALAAWRPASVVLGFDQDPDPSTRVRVDQAQHDLAALLTTHGLKTYVVHWPDGIKGLDDALEARVPLQIRRWNAELAIETEQQTKKMIEVGIS